MTEPTSRPVEVPSILEAYRRTASDTAEDLLRRAKAASAAELHRRGRSPDEGDVIIRARAGKRILTDGDEVARIASGNTIVAKRVRS